MIEMFRCIAADPPWDERGGCGRGTGNHYSTMSVPDIAKTMLRAPCWRPAESCHLWVWATMSHLPGALSVMDALGFRYVTHGVWVKPSFGMGRYMRGQHELFLLGTRGDACVPEHAPPSIVLAPKGAHSEKPAAAYALFEQVSPGPRLEMFARAERPGWVVWGDEAP